MSKQKLIIVADSPCVENGSDTENFTSYENSTFVMVLGHGMSFLPVVVADKAIHEAMLKDTTAKDYSVIDITVTYSEETLRERRRKRRDAKAMSFSLRKGPLS